jgi:hypothetical protein
VLSVFAQSVVQRALAADVPSAEEHEAIADAGRVGDLMDRQEQRAAASRLRAERRRNLAALSKVQPLERLVGKEHRRRHQQADRQHDPLPLPLRQRPNRMLQQRCQGEPGDEVLAQIPASPEKSDGKVERPADRLCRPGRDRVGQIEQRAAAFASCHRMAAEKDAPIRRGQHPRHAFEQRRLARSVGSDQAEDFAWADGKTDTGERGERAVMFRQSRDTQPFGHIPGIRSFMRSDPNGGTTTSSRK